MTGGLEPIDGMVKRHNHLKIGMYHQHLTDLLDPKLNPLEYMVSLPAGRARVSHLQASSCKSWCVSACPAVVCSAPVGSWMLWYRITGKRLRS